MGGTIYNELNVALSVQESTFTSNYAQQNGGAIDVRTQSALRLSNCRFEDNLAEQWGG